MSLFEKSWRHILIGSSPRRAVIRALSVALATWLIARYVVVPISPLGSGSFHLVSPLLYDFRGPQRGESVAIRMAGRELVVFRRVIGLPGERVEVQRGVLKINDQPVVDDRILLSTNLIIPERQLKADEIFVLADDASSEADQAQGTVELSKIEGSLLW